MSKKYNISVKVEYAHGVLCGESYANGKLDCIYEEISEGNAIEVLDKIAEIYQGDDVKHCGLKLTNCKYLLHRTNDRYGIPPHVYSWVNVEEV